MHQEYRAIIITASDKGSLGEREDRSGPRIRELLTEIGISVSGIQIVADELDLIEAQLMSAVDEQAVDLVVTTGGTGLSPRDVTPEATKRVIDYEVPGMSEAMRAEGMKHTPRAMLSRGIVGVRKFSLIINLPGSVKAVEENLAAVLPVLPHALQTLRGAAEDCGRV